MRSSESDLYEGLLDGLESSELGCARVSFDGRVVRANAALCAMLGYERGDLLGRRFDDLVDRDEADTIRSYLAGIPDAETPGHSARLRLVDTNGRALRVALTAIRAGERGIAGGTCVVLVENLDRPERGAGDPGEHETRYEALFQQSPESVAQVHLDYEPALRAILDNLPYRVWLKNSEGRYIAANRAFIEAAGKTRLDEVVGRTAHDIWPEEAARRFEIGDRNAIESGDRVFDEFRVVENGRPIWIETYRAAIVDERGTVLGTTGCARDITERREAEEQQQLAAMIYRESSEAIVVTDAENLIIDVNPAFTRITGYAPDEVIGRNPSVLASGRHDNSFYEAMWNALLAEGQWQGEIWDRRKDGSIYAKWSSICLIRDPDGNSFRHIALFSDITEKKRADELIWRQANYDPLTGLPNRHLFLERLAQAIRQERRRGQRLALLFVDLDRFKEVNDSLGHGMGDLLLEQVAQRLRDCVRESDIVARLAGDEFTVIVPGLLHATHAEIVAQKIIDALGAPYDLEGDLEYVSASVGIAFFPDDATEMEELLRFADRAMYGAKRAGHGGFSYYTASMQREAITRMHVTDALREALARRELQVHYQPIIALSDGRVAKAEALLRWRHDRLGEVGPARFVPLAEDAGLIGEIGDWVFATVVEQVADWKRRYGQWVHVCVNLSLQQFLGDWFGEAWIARMRDVGMPGRCITVEVTESMLVKDASRTWSRLQLLHEAGLQISVDGFATGVSSLPNLRKFPIGSLKIDRSYVARMGEDRGDLALVEAIISMARKLGIETVAEGVETQAQRDRLVEFGCDYAQGFYYWKALPADELERLLNPEDP